MAELVQEWDPQPKPTWVTCVPSNRHPQLVPDLASQVARQLGLDFVQVLHRVEHRPPQKEQQNSAHQQRNVQGAFAVKGEVPDGPVLLVDDIVDSAWTMTEVGRLLRRAGVSVVYPVALASSAGRS